MPASFRQHTSSYRDPSGFLFYKDGTLYRQVNTNFQRSFDRFTNEGLYQQLVEKRMLIPHQLLKENLTGTANCYVTLLPEVIPFISYPYEWGFDMLRDAALLTLDMAREAISHGMILKDASAYNTQLHKGRMIFIDSLSFEEYDETKPWVAYRQFCEHFLAPLALIHYLNTPLQNILVAYPEGIPLNLASKLLPFKSKLNLHTHLHIHLQSSLSQKQVTRTSNVSRPFTKKKMQNVLQSLEQNIRAFSLSESPTAWSSYYDEATQRGDYVASKKQIVADWLSRLNFKTVLDAGANEGEFTEIAAKYADYVISADLDHASVNKLYNKIKRQGLTNIHPLVIDLANPSPSIGVNNAERSSFLNRTNVDLTLALALVHHLALAKNIPFKKIACTFYSITKYLVIEFIPPSDEKVLQITENKKELLKFYTEESFLEAFGLYFSLLERNEISNSGRTLFLMERLETNSTT